MHALQAALQVLEGGSKALEAFKDSVDSLFDTIADSSSSGSVCRSPARQSLGRRFRSLLSRRRAELQVMTEHLDKANEGCSAECERIIRDAKQKYPEAHALTALDDAVYSLRKRLQGGSGGGSSDAGQSSSHAWALDDDGPAAESAPAAAEGPAWAGIMTQCQMEAVAGSAHAQGSVEAAAEQSEEQIFLSAQEANSGNLGGSEVAPAGQLQLSPPAAEAEQPGVPTTALQEDLQDVPPAKPQTKQPDVPLAHPTGDLPCEQGKQAEARPTQGSGEQQQPLDTVQLEAPAPRQHQAGSARELGSTMRVDMNDLRPTATQHLGEALAAATASPLPPPAVAPGHHDGAKTGAQEAHPLASPAPSGSEVDVVGTASQHDPDTWRDTSGVKQPPTSQTARTQHVPRRLEFAAAAQLPEAQQDAQHGSEGAAALAVGDAEQAAAPASAGTAAGLEGVPEQAVLAPPGPDVAVAAQEGEQADASQHAAPAGPCVVLRP